MLERLVVSNFAIIENIDISFKDGLTVLTGETGAGKSLIIDSLSLLLGERAQLEMIRTGFDKAEIIGYFNINNIHLKALLENLNIPIIDSKIKVQRIISQTKSAVKINDTAITLQDLKKISKYLADIHMQFDMQKILNPENYLEIVDGFKYDLIKEYQDKYLLNLSSFREKKNELNMIQKKIDDINQKRDIYEYHLKELTDYNLSLDEENKIQNKIELLKNYDKVYNILEETNALVHEDFLDKLYEVRDLTEKLSKYQKEYSSTTEKLNDYYFEIDSIFNDLKKDFDKLDYDPVELNNLETRLNDLDNLKKKYKMSTEELISYRDSLSNLLKPTENYDDILKEIKLELINLYAKTYESALELSKIRENISSSIEKELEKNMADLSLKARFKVDFIRQDKEVDYSGTIFKDSGIDNIDFLIETNVGEGLKPLSKTISGGEASRIMLALKALFIKSQKISTVIFDEIDTGISGEIAGKVANKIYEISLSTQVISITHLPQVASMSKNHLKISKEVKNGRTYTSVSELSLDEKIYEIAKMISGDKVTDSQLKYAKEMVIRN
ncbi:DNA repair protein RecN [bacterium]|nr:DNA repair protein RecN [bacterium]